MKKRVKLCLNPCGNVEMKFDFYFACVQFITTQRKYIWDSICWTVGFTDFTKFCSNSLIPDSH